MLQDIRANSQGTIAKIIIGLIVISFSIFGIESLLFSANTNAVAEVNGEEITPFELQQELSLQQRQLLAMLGENADPALLDQAVMSRQALDVLIQRKVVMQASDNMELTAADSALADIIGSMEQFQIDGQFSRDMFQSSLASAGFTPALFRERLAQDVRVGQLRAGLAGSDFATSSELELAAAISEEGRDVRYISLPLIDFLAATTVDEADIEAFYAANNERFLSPETVSMDYVELQLEDYVQPVGDERLREEFDLVRDQYEIATETRVSHILLEGSTREREARVAEVLAALDSGTAFEAAATEFSDDIGSSGAGGDLGYTAGSTFPEPMEEALALLLVGDVSRAVETDAGTHVLKVTDRREGSDVSFEDVALELEQQIQRDDAAAELVRAVERLSDLVFNAIDLSDPAAAMGLDVQRAEAVARSQRDGAITERVLLQAAFSDDVLQERHNSEVIEVSPERFVALRVAERQAPAVRPLADVRNEIERELREQAARDSAEAAGQGLLAELESGVSVEEAANAAGLDWQVELSARRDSQRLPVTVRDSVFAMTSPEGAAPLRSIVSEGVDASYVVELSRVTPGSIELLPDPQRQLLNQRLAGESGGLVQQQFEASLRARAEVEVY